jgi:hypothetical protein
MGMMMRSNEGNSTSKRCMSSEHLPLARYGLGGAMWKRFDPKSYQELIFQALTKKVSYFEVAGQEGGDIAMVGAVQSALERNPEFLSATVTITTRLGYRIVDEEEAPDGSGGSGGVNGVQPKTKALRGDVILSEQPSNKSYNITPGNVVHNLSSDYILRTVESSPLLELHRDMENLKLVFLLHNPEVQVVDLLKEDPNAAAEARLDFVQQRSKPAMEALQEYTAGVDPKAFSFGVVSNGLGIPEGNNHPMHLNSNLVIEASKAYSQFSTVELPANLLETYGWEMARKIKAQAPRVTISAMRPLTCYPDLGTGSGYPFRLVDYALPTLDDQSIGTFDDQTASIKPGMGVRYTNEMSGIPAIYQMALQAAMSHFDAERLLEVKQERDLTMEERETLDGCKLVQSMIHDLDNQLEHVRSFAAHEDELYGKIIPLLYDTFELMDDRTSDVLQAFFAAYAVAVRYAIAKKTREVLRNGDSDKRTGITYPDIPQSITLQDYALRHLLADKCFDRIVIGASTMQDFQHQTEVMEAIASDSDPLEAIKAAAKREMGTTSSKGGEDDQGTEK